MKVGKSPLRGTKSGVSRTRQNLLTQWVQSLHIWEQVTQKDLPEHLRTGILLVRIIEAYDPTPQFTIYKRPVAKKACISNIEQALSVIWKKSMAASAIPSSEDIYFPRADKSWSLLNCLFEAYPLQEARTAMKDALPMLQRTLSLYGRQLLPQSVAPPFLTLFDDCVNCVSLICFLHCFTPAGVDMKDVYWSPENQGELEENVRYFFGLLANRALPALFTPTEFMEKSDLDFLLLQIHLIYASLKDISPCLTDSRNLIFKDDSRLRSRPAPEVVSNRSSSSLFSLESPSLTYSISTRMLSDAQLHSRDSSTSTSNLPPPGSFSHIAVAPLIAQKLTKERLDSINNSSAHQGEGSSFGTRLEESKEIQFESVSPPPEQTSYKTGKLAKMERMNMMQERKLLYLADMRRKAELDVQLFVPRSISPHTEKGRSRSPTSYHLQNPKYYQSQTSLTLTESLTCFLMTPRILRLSVNSEPDFFPFVFNLVPNEQKFSSNSEYYFFEWRDLTTLEVVGSLDMSHMVSVAKDQGNMFVLKYPTFPDSAETVTAYLIDCTDRSECNKYIEGLTYLLHRGRKRSLLP